MESVVIECPQCEKAQNAPIQGEYTHYYEEPGEPYRYRLLECPTCHSPILTSEDYDWTSDNYCNPKVLHPKLEHELDWDIPRTIRSTFHEAQDCFKAKAFTATAIMCRRCLEAVCVDEGIKKGSLAGKISQLKSSAIIDGTLFEWAELLRVSGNKAAHDVSSNTKRQDAQDILEFSHALIEYLYTYRNKYSEFKKRSEKKDVAES